MIEAKKFEEARKAQENLNRRVKELSVYEYTHDIYSLQLMEESDFLLLLEERKNVFTIKQAEATRLEAEATTQKLAEETRINNALEEMKKQRAELDAQKAVQDAIAAEQKSKEDALKQKELEAQKKIDDENAKIALEKAKAEATEKGRLEAEAKMKLDLLAKQAKENEEMELMEKRKKYQTWLTDNKYKEDGSFYLQKTTDGKKMILWKKVSEFNI